MSPTHSPSIAMSGNPAHVGPGTPDPVSTAAESSVSNAVAPPVAPAPQATASRIDLANVALGQVVRGRYRVGRMWHIVRGAATNYWVVELVDRTGTLRAYGWPDRVTITTPYAEGSLVEVELVVKFVSGLKGKLHKLAPVGAVSAADLIATLPHGVCPIPDVVDGIHEVVNSIQTSALQRFLANVFSDIDSCRRYFVVPASFRDHHSEQGGMARHCLQGARIIASMEGLDGWFRELAVVCFLVHDIGKTWTHSKRPLHFEFFHLIEHDDLSLELLAHPLKQLDLDWPHGGLAVRHCLTCASQGARYGKKPAMPIADLVHGVDRLSQLIDLVERFCDPAGGMTKLDDGRWIWQPAKP